MGSSRDNGFNGPIYATNIQPGKTGRRGRPEQSQPHRTPGNRGQPLHFLYFPQSVTESKEGQAPVPVDSSLAGAYLARRNQMQWSYSSSPLTVFGASEAQGLPVPLNHQRLDEVHFPIDLVPENYKCELNSVVMSDPVKLPQTPQICDRSGIEECLRRSPKNPFNRQPLHVSGLESQTALAKEITSYVDAITAAIKQRQVQSDAALTEADYRAIHEAAIQLVQNQQAAAPQPKGPSFSPSGG